MDKTELQLNHIYITPQSKFLHNTQVSTMIGMVTKGNPHCRGHIYQIPTYAGSYSNSTEETEA